MGKAARVSRECRGNRGNVRHGTNELIRGAHSANAFSRGSSPRETTETKGATMPVYTTETIEEIVELAELSAFDSYEPLF